MALQLRPLYSAVAGEAMLLTAMCSLQQLVLSCWGATRARLVVCHSKSDTLVVNVGELGGEAAEESMLLFAHGTADGSAAVLIFLHSMV